MIKATEYNDYKEYEELKMAHETYEEHLLRYGKFLMARMLKEDLGYSWLEDRMKHNNFAREAIQLIRDRSERSVDDTGNLMPL